MTEWIKVEERLPSNGQRCLVFATIHVDANYSWRGILDAHFCHNYGWNRNDHIDDKVFITHWTNMIEAPHD